MAVVFDVVPGNLMRMRNFSLVVVAVFCCCALHFLLPLITVVFGGRLFV